MNSRHGSLADEIKQTRPFPSLAQEAIVAIMRTADEVKRKQHATLASHGITIQQYNVLRILRGAGDEPLPTLEIADRMIEHAPGVTRLIDRLIEKGLVCREDCPEDRRVVYCRITATGLDLLSELDVPVQEGADRQLMGLTKEEVRQLIELMDKVRQPRH